MGLTITGDYKGAPFYDMGYITFGLLRMDIASAINAEYGDHYKDMYYHRRSDWTEYNKKTAKLEKKWKLKMRATDFLWMSDCEGRLSPCKCKALLDSIDKMSEGIYGYRGLGIEKCLTTDKFKNLLRNCYEKKCYMIWM